jgi:hypothetical protein
MKQEKIQAVRNELDRMLKALNALENERSPERLSSGTAFYFSAPKLTGSVRRASMDLTRALADLRRAD